jgi:DNA recombination protein RmuC
MHEPGRERVLLLDLDFTFMLQISLFETVQNLPAIASVVIASVSLGFVIGYGVRWRAGRGVDGASGMDLLLKDLRGQIDAQKTELAQEREARMKEAQRASGAESAADAARAAWGDGETRFERELKRMEEAAERLRQESHQERTRLEERYAKELLDLKGAFGSMSQEVLRGMAPDVTKEVATKVEPLIAQMQNALVNYQASLQQGLSGQGEVLVAVREQMMRVSETTESLATSTRDFTMVLKSGQHRGRWGEQTLRRVVEASGLSPHCDYVEQESQDNTRPDLLIKLPGNRCVIVDSKVPELDAAIACETAPQRKELVKAHAQKLRSTVMDLAAKDYPGAQRRAGRVPFEHVVLFLPAESLLSTALEGDTELVVDAGRQGILLATPATLIGFLAAISLTWQQHHQAENGAKIAEEALTLYQRVEKLMEHIDRLRSGLQGAVTGFNQAIGSYERMVRPSGERLKSLGGAGRQQELPPVEQVEEAMRELRE